jgi:hypothetical protein
MCLDQEFNIILMKFLNNFGTVSVMVINFVLRYIVIWMIGKLCYKTRSLETRDIMYLVFFIQFLNTGIFILLVNYDLSSSLTQYLPFWKS